MLSRGKHTWLIVALMTSLYAVPGQAADTGPDQATCTENGLVLQANGPLRLASWNPPACDHLDVMIKGTLVVIPEGVRLVAGDGPTSRPHNAMCHAGQVSADGLVGKAGGSITILAERLVLDGELKPGDGGDGQDVMISALLGCSGAKARGGDGGPAGTVDTPAWEGQGQIIPARGGGGGNAWVTGQGNQTNSRGANGTVLEPHAQAGEAYAPSATTVDVYGNGLPGWDAQASGGNGGQGDYGGAGGAGIAEGGSGAHGLHQDAIYPDPWGGRGGSSGSAGAYGGAGGLGVWGGRGGDAVAIAGNAGHGGNSTRPQVHAAGGGHEGGAHAFGGYGGHGYQSTGDGGNATAIGGISGAGGHALVLDGIGGWAGHLGPVIAEGGESPTPFVTIPLQSGSGGDATAVGGTLMAPGSGCAAHGTAGRARDVKATAGTAGAGVNSGLDGSANKTDVKVMPMPDDLVCEELTPEKTTTPDRGRRETNTPGPGALVIIVLVVLAARRVRTRGSGSA